MTYWPPGALIPATDVLDKIQLRSFQFFELPGEIRNTVYDLVFQECEVEVWCNHPQKELKQRQKDEAQKSGRKEKPRNRLYSRNPTVMTIPSADRAGAVHDLQNLYRKAWQPWCLPNVPHCRFNQEVGLIQTCRLAHSEAIPFLYGKTAFRFNSPNTVKMFLNIAPVAGKQAIEKIGLKHATYGEPQLTDFRFWKKSHDRKWADVCERLKEEMTSMKHMELQLRICDWPTQLNLSAAWAKPLLVLKGDGLEQVDVLLLHRSFNQLRLDAASRMVEDAMMTEAGKEKKRHEADMAQIIAMEAAEAREREREKLRVASCKVLKITMPKPAPPKKATKKAQNGGVRVNPAKKACQEDKMASMDIMVRKRHAKKMQF